MKDNEKIIIQLREAGKSRQEIADTLDRLDRLCNDLSSGLPAEIEARRKQYEYYRDKLLSFKDIHEEMNDEIRKA